MGELAEAGCVAFSQGGCAARRHAGAAPRDAVRGDFRPSRLAAAAGCHISRGPASRTTARSRRASGSRPYPSSAETIALATILALVRETGARVHLARLSTADGVAMVRAAKKDKLPVTCDVAVHHLHLCDVDIGWFDAQCSSRSAAAQHARSRRAARGARRWHDRSRLLRSHAGRRRCEAVAVRRSRAGRDGPGTPAAADAQMGERRQGRVARGARAHHRAIRPRFSGSMRGISAVGSAADVCIFDPEASGRSSPATLRSQGKNTPFLGLEVAGPRQGDAGRRSGRL